MNIKNKKAVVLGGTGGVGEGIVKALMKKGAIVIVPTRSEAKIAKLKDYVSDVKTGTLIPFVGSVNTEESAQALATYLMKEYKQIDIAVASLGGWHQGFPIYSYPADQWHRILSDNLTSHFLAIKTLVPLLNSDESYYFHINGFSADQPYPMAGPVAMTAAAQKSLIQTLSLEVGKTGIKVFELILGPMKTRDRLKHGHGQADWYFPEEVGEFIISQTQSVQQEVIHYLLSKNK